MATGLSANYPYCASLAVFCAGAVVLSGLQLNISRGCWTQSQLSDVSSRGGRMDEDGGKCAFVAILRTHAIVSSLD